MPITLILHQACIQPEIFWDGHSQILEGQNFFVYSDENEGIKCLFRYYSLKLIITNSAYGIL